MNRRFAWLLCLVALWSDGVPSLVGAEVSPTSNPQTVSAQDFAKQQQIKATTKRVGDQLEGVIGEFDLNGITGNFAGSEFAGACYSPGGRWLFVNVQSPGITLAITGPWGRGGL